MDRVNVLYELDELLSKNTEAFETLPIEKRATIPLGLPSELSIKDIATLAYPQDKEKQLIFRTLLIDLCKSNVMPYYGDIEGWSYRDDTPNPFPKIKDQSAFGGLDYIDSNSLLFFGSDACLIHRDVFKRYLQSQKQWPINGLLANWWCKDEQNAKSRNNAKKEKPDHLRTEHVKLWIESTKYTGGKSDKQINTELKTEKPDLWGDKMDTFRKWIQSEEAMQVKALLPNSRRKCTY